MFANWDAHQNRLEDPGLVGSLVLAVRHWGFTPEHLFTAFLEAYYFPPLLSAPASRSLYTPAAPALLPFRYAPPPTHTVCVCVVCVVSCDRACHVS